MFDFLDTVRRLPPETRKLIAFIGTAATTFLIGAIWFVGVSRSVSETTLSLTAKKDVSPFEAIKNNFAGVASSFKNGIQEINNELSRAGSSTAKALPDDLEKEFESEAENAILESYGDGEQP